MDGAHPPRGWSRLLGACLFGILAVAVGFRLYALGRLPGINGDEAWYGVLAELVGHPNPHGWVTPSGNPPGPFQLGLLALLSRALPPAFALLRVPSVLASLGQGLLTYVIARRHLGREVAIVALLLTAALPAEIVYARFGWDPSHSGVVIIAALHFALGRRVRAVAALFALAIWVHPTNLFVAPFLIFALAFAEENWRPAVRRVLLASLVAGVALVAVVAVKSAVTAGAARPGGMLSRLIDPRQWARFAVLLVRLVDGDTVYTYVTGAGYGAARLPIDLAAALLIGAVAVVGGPRLKGQPLKLGVVVGWVASVAAFFVFAGPDALQPHFERYGMCLMVPTILALSILATEAVAGLRSVAAVAVVCVALLFGFQRCYFRALETTGSTSHETFWTGPVEPKAEALRRIEAASPRGARVVAESWWLFWPLAYLANGTNVEVVDVEHLEDTPFPAGTWVVGFPHGRVEAWARSAAAARLVWEIPGAAGRVVIQVWRSPGP